MADDRNKFSGNKLGRLVAKDLSQSLGKLPPQEVELEETVLGAIMLESAALLVALEILTPKDFYDDRHAEVFQAIADLSNEGKPVDIRTVVYQLKKNGKLELVGGAYIVPELTSKVNSGANIEMHCRVIQEARIRRDIILMAGQLMNEAYEEGQDVFQLMDKLAAFPISITDGLKGQTERHIKDGITNLAQDINTREDNMPEIIGVPSGFQLIDKVTLGWRPGKLIIMAGRPGMGKTTLALNFMRNAAVDFKVPVSFFSLEMTFDELVAICVAIDTEMELKHITSKPFTPLDMDRFVHSTAPLTKANIYIDDTPSLSITALRTKARRHKEKYGTGMIIVDYIQLMRGEHHTLKFREQEISSISRGLKLIAMELKIPVIAMSQLSREVEKRTTKKPIMADLRESGSLEQDADMVMLLWRPEYYQITGDGDGTFINGATEANIVKHRGGAVSAPFLQFLPKKSKFVNIDSPYENKQSISLPPVQEVQPQNNEDAPF